jgi:hypothetical protein
LSLISTTARACFGAWLATFACSFQDLDIRTHPLPHQGLDAAGGGGGSASGGGNPTTDGSASSTSPDSGSGGEAGAAGGNSGGAGGTPDAACPEFQHPTRLECQTFEEATQECLTTALAEEPDRRVDRPDCDLGCFCSRCVDSFSLCGLDPGCRAIIQCAADTGCDGVNCYGTAFCQAVIDAQGGPLANSALFAIQFNDCRTTRGCAIDCPAPDAGMDASEWRDSTADGG